MPSSAFQTCALDRKSTRLNSSHTLISYAVFCLTKKSRGSEEHTSELQSQSHLVCRLLLAKTIATPCGAGGPRASACRKFARLLASLLPWRSSVFFFKRLAVYEALLFSPTGPLPS